MSCNDNSTDSKSPSECTKSECIDNQDGNVFKCRKCGRNVHFECSQLPAYQIQTFLKYKTIRSNYICQNCIQPEVWVKDLIKNSVTSDAAQTETISMMHPILLLHKLQTAKILTIYRRKFESRRN